MLVLVTGGAGFIGSHSVDGLLADGAKVRVLDNFSTGKKSNLPDHPRLEIIQGDIRDTETVAGAMKDITHVLHLAAQVSVPASVADPITSSQHNIQGFLNVFDSARRAGVKRFVYASSAAVYGSPEQLPLSETSPVAPLSPYGLEKRHQRPVCRTVSRAFPDFIAGAALLQRLRTAPGSIVFLRGGHQQICCRAPPRRKPEGIR